MANKPVRKGDMMDGILWAAGLAQQKNEPVQIADYPETVLETLRLFQKLWNIPASVIPPKQIKGRYEMWINQLNELNRIAGSHIGQVMAYAHQRFEKLPKKWFVTKPADIQRLMEDTLRLMIEEATKESKESDSSSQEKIIPATKEETKDVISDLRSFFEKESDN